MSNNESAPAPSEAFSPNVLPLMGAVDVSVVRSLWAVARACADAPGDVTVACAALERIDSSGVQVLLSLKIRLEASGRAMHIRDVPEHVFGLLLQTGLAQALVARPTGGFADVKATAPTMPPPYGELQGESYPPSSEPNAVEREPGRAVLEDDPEDLSARLT